MIKIEEDITEDNITDEPIIEEEIILDEMEDKVCPICGKLLEDNFCCLEND